MANDFTDLRIWQKAHQLTLEIYSLTKNFPKDELYSLTNQIRRAAVSIEANIAEGHGRYHPKDIVRFMHDSRGSIYEVQSELMIARDVKYCSEQKINSLISEYTDLAKQINSFIRAKSL